MVPRKDGESDFRAGYKNGVGAGVCIRGKSPKVVCENLNTGVCKCIPLKILKVFLKDILTNLATMCIMCICWGLGQLCSWKVGC